MRHRVTPLEMVALDNRDFRHEDYINDIFHYFNHVDAVGNALRYDWALQELKSNLFSWVKAGAIAFRIKLQRTYKSHYANWQEFCQKALGRTHTYMNRIIEAARVVKDLAENGFKVLPANESQARGLAKYKGDELCDKWQLVLDEHPVPHHLTAQAINETLGIVPKVKKLSVSKDVWQRFEEKARELNLDPTQLAESLLDNWNEEPDELDACEEVSDTCEEVSEEQLERWEADLDQLIQEKTANANWLIFSLLGKFLSYGSPNRGLSEFAGSVGTGAYCFGGVP